MLAWATDLGPCVVCPMEGGTCSGPVQGHHAVPRQTLRKWGLPLWDIRNRVAVCEWRHEQHTTAYRRIPLRALSADVWAFAAEYGFVDYLHKTYEGDERLPAADFIAFARYMNGVCPKCGKCNAHDRTPRCKCAEAK